MEFGQDGLEADIEDDGDGQLMKEQEYYPAA